MESNPTFPTCGTQGCEYPARYCIDHAHGLEKRAERRIVEWLREHGNDGIYSRSEQETWLACADAIERGAHR